MCPQVSDRSSSVRRENLIGKNSIVDKRRRSGSWGHSYFGAVFATEVGKGNGLER